MDYNITPKWVLLESLVLASDWVLARHSSGLTIRGSPVTPGYGSPLGVALKTAGSRLLMAGSVMEAELENPGNYKRAGKDKVSMLIVGYYCSKKQAHEEGAGFQVC